MFFRFSNMIGVSESQKVDRNNHSQKTHWCVFRGIIPLIIKCGIFEIEKDYLPPYTLVLFSFHSSFHFFGSNMSNLTSDTVTKGKVEPCANLCAVCEDCKTYLETRCENCGCCEKGCSCCSTARSSAACDCYWRI